MFYSLDEAADAQTPQTSSSSDWFSRISSFVNTAGQATGNVLGALRGNRTQPSNVTGLDTGTNWKPILLIGGAIVVLVVIIALIRK